jgi:hypothetical protein
MESDNRASNYLKLQAVRRLISNTTKDKLIAYLQDIMLDYFMKMSSHITSGEGTENHTNCVKAGLHLMSVVLWSCEIRVEEPEITAELQKIKREVEKTILPCMGEYRSLFDSDAKSVDFLCKYSNMLEFIDLESLQRLRTIISPPNCFVRIKRHPGKPKAQEEIPFKAMFEEIEIVDKRDMFSLLYHKGIGILPHKNDWAELLGWFSVNLGRDIESGEQINDIETRRRMEISPIINAKP